ncbi:hypothetical protein MCOR31_009036 [Pyricularia oryzae]|nr:hypothetical protein MCOR31_009036 [Pyricularia oryzae]KAI6434226.1 hypothetical protein MCOR21_002432 [Pyricularia oryzae]
MTNADMFPEGFIPVGGRGGPPPPRPGMGGPPRPGPNMMAPRPQPHPVMAQPNMGQPINRPPMMSRLVKKRSTHEISDLRDEFRSPEDCRDRLTTYYVFRIEPVEGDEGHTVEGEKIQSTWMNAHVTEIEDLPRKEIIRQIRQLNEASDSGVAEKKKGMGAGQQRQIEKARKKLETHELVDPEHFEITLVQLDDKRRELTDKEYKKYEKKLHGGAKAGTTTVTTVLISKPNGQVKKKKKKMEKRVSITAYFKNAPKPGVDVEALLKEREIEEDIKAQRIHHGIDGLSGPHDFPPDSLMNQMPRFPQGPPQGQFPIPGQINANLGPPRQGPLPPRMPGGQPPRPMQNGHPQPPRPPVGRPGPAGRPPAGRPPVGRPRSANQGRDGRRRDQSDTSSPDSDSGSESDSGGSSSSGSWSGSEDEVSMPTSHGSISDGRRRKRQKSPKKYVRGSEYHSRSSSRRHNHNDGEYTLKANGGRRQQTQTPRREPQIIMPHVPNAPASAPVIVQHPMMQQQHHHQQYQQQPVLHQQHPMVPAIDIHEAYNRGRIHGKAEEREETRLIDEAAAATNRRLPERLATQPRYLPGQLPGVRLVEPVRTQREIAAEIELEERERIAAAAVAAERIRVEKEKHAAEAKARAAWYRQREAERQEEEYWRKVEEQDERERAARLTIERERRAYAAYMRDSSPDINPFPRPQPARKPTVSYRDRDTYHYYEC